MRKRCGSIVMVNLGGVVLFVAATNCALTHSQQTAAASLKQGESGAASTASRRSVQPGDAEIERMSQFLATRLDRSTIRTTLTTADGREIDCVDINRQPALQSPVLSGHVLQLAPATLPVPYIAEAEETIAADAEIVVELPILAKGEPLYAVDTATGGKKPVAGCPETTVPIRGITMEDLLRFDSLDDFQAGGRAYKRAAAIERAAGLGASPVIGRSNKLDAGTQQGKSLKAEIPSAATTSVTGEVAPDGYFHEYAKRALQESSHGGGDATFNVWKPAVMNDEISIVQMWVSGFSANGRQTVEVGSEIYPDYYGDHDPHLFTFTTPDEYAHYCVNLCSWGPPWLGFVQIHPYFFPGMKLSPVSQLNGKQTEVKLGWYKDGPNGEWWLQMNDQWVGYFPHTYYADPGIAKRGTNISFGGEIINTQPLGFHTSTDMGAGKLPSTQSPLIANNVGKAAYIRRVHFTTATNPIVSGVPLNLPLFLDTPGCYQISSMPYDVNWGRYFFFGGPGFSPTCLF